MYESEYGTDWTSVTTEEAIERAYAVGVAQSLGEEHPGELARLLDVTETAGDRALVQLAYDKGRSRGQSASTDEETTDTAWNSVVNDDERSTVTIDERTHIPRAVRRLPLLTNPREGDGLLQLPKFLLR